MTVKLQERDMVWYPPDIAEQMPDGITLIQVRSRWWLVVWTTPSDEDEDNRVTVTVSPDPDQWIGHDLAAAKLEPWQPPSTDVAELTAELTLIDEDKPDA